MDGDPSTPAWVALAALLASFLAGALVERRREPADDAPPSSLPKWVMPASAAAGGCPVAAALIMAASLPTVAWWLMLAPAATGVLVAVVGTTAVLAAQWARWRREMTQDERPAVAVVATLSLASTLALPVVGAALLVVDRDVSLAVAASLVASYALWRLALAVTRHSLL